MLLGSMLLGTWLAPATPAVAQSSGELQFLDPRPIVIDLDSTKSGQKWRVSLLTPDVDANDITLHVVFDPAEVITIDESVGESDEAGIVEFVITLERRVEGSGELVAVGAGTVARRDISTQFGALGGALPIGGLQFSGERIAPFTDLVRIPDLQLTNVPETRKAEPELVGVLTSAGGGVVDVVRDGDLFSVTGAGGVGEFTGTVDLLPRRDGGEAEATVRVRDFLAWPLLVLLAGLSVAQLLDRYQLRQRPVKLHARRLAVLRERARAGERQTAGWLRITTRRGQPDELLLDQLIGEARVAFHPHLTDTERAAWEPGGAEYERLATTVAQFQDLCRSFKGFQDERDAFITSADPPDRLRIGRALAASVVADALSERSITSLDQITEAERQLSAGREYLSQFKRIYERLARLRSMASEEVGTAAERILAEELLRASTTDDLAGVDESSRELNDTWQAASFAGVTSSWGAGPPPQPGAAQPPAPGYGQPAGYGPPGFPYGQPGYGGQPVPRPRRRLPVGLVAALAVAAVGVVAVSLVSVDILGPAGGERPPPNPATETPSAAPGIPVAPVAVPPAGDTVAAVTPSTAQTAWFGVVVPILLAVAAAVLGWLLLRWRQRRTQPPREALDSWAIDREIRREDRRFSLAAGTLVVLTGISVLYVGNATFGSPGDYLGIALWGAAVGEGLQLARRLWPSLPTSASS